MCRLLRVTGESLSPVLKEGDFVLISKVPFFFRSLQVGDIVAFKQAYYGTMIKVVERISTDEDEIYVVGFHEKSVDSRHFGPISKKQVLGKVIFHIDHS